MYRGHYAEERDLGRGKEDEGCCEGKFMDRYTFISVRFRLDLRLCTD